MDDTSSANVEGLQQVTRQYCRKHEKTLDAIAAALRTASNEAQPSGHWTD
jgi:hypothetical protein